MNNEFVTMAPAIEALTSMYLTRLQRGERNRQFGQVSKRRVEQTADGVAGLRRHRFGGVTQQRGERHDGEHRQDEQQRVCFRLE